MIGKQGQNVMANETVKPDVEREQLICRLDHAPASFKSSKRSAESGCFPGTRTALLDTIKRWALSSEVDEKPVFWLQGLAGIGKLEPNLMTSGDP